MSLTKRVIQELVDGEDVPSLKEAARFNLLGIRAVTS
jgi:hypothetical protein